MRQLGSYVHPPIMVLYCIMLHVCWAGLLWTHSGAIGATAVAGPFEVFKSRELLATVLLASSIAAATAILSKFPLNVILLLPQQALLQMSAASAIAAMFAGQFADGVERPIGFIIADQLHIVLAAFGHGVAIISLGVTKRD